MSTIRAGNTNTTAVTVTADLTGQLNLESQNGIVNINGTGALDLPTGTTGQRPGSPSSGMTRYNTTISAVEVYNGTEWKPVGSVYDTDSTSTGYFDLPSGTTGQRPASPNTGYIRYNTTTSSLEVYNGSSWVAASAVYDTATSSTGYFQVPSGTTAQRPATPATGMIRYNTTNQILETYNGAAWIDLGITGASYNIEYLIVGGGGGGGGGQGGEGSAGGGGAGGVLDGSVSITPAVNYSIVIGGGGNGSSGDTGANGTNSTAFSLTAIGGGGGAQGSAGGQTAGSSGGSGGGSGYYGNTAGSGTSGQGYAGGTSPNTPGGGGGGGAGGVGNNSTSAKPGDGGIGINWKNLGTYYAGGGGAGRHIGNSTSTLAVGGLGGGGTGGDGDNSPTATAATANTGGGGGGGGENPSSLTTGGNGGSGIVIIRYLGSARGTGGTVTASGGYTYHTFTTSGTFTA